MDRSIHARMDPAIHSQPPGGMKRIGPWKRTVQNQRELDRLMYAEITERRQAPDLAERTDVLSRLIREGQGDDAQYPPLADEEMRDQLVTLLLAGHETTSTALTFTLHLLGRHPSEQRLVHDEIDTVLDGRAPTLDDAARELVESTENAELFRHAMGGYGLRSSL